MKGFGIRLGFTYPEVSHILLDNHYNIHDAIFQMLIKWRQKNTGGEEGADILKKALESCGLKIVESQAGKYSIIKRGNILQQ